MKHTPLPWLADNGDSEVWGIFDDNGAELAYLIKLPSIEPSKEFDESKANAEFIFRACNSHYDLLEAAKLVEGMFSVWLLDTHRSPITMKVGIDKLRKATAKAEGKE